MMLPLVFRRFLTTLLRGRDACRQGDRDKGTRPPARIPHTPLPPSHTRLAGERSQNTRKETGFSAPFFLGEHSWLLWFEMMDVAGGEGRTEESWPRAQSLMDSLCRLEKQGSVELQYTLPHSRPVS